MHDALSSSALPFGSITLFSSRTPPPTTPGEDGSQAGEVLWSFMGAGLGPRQSSQGWAEVMRGLLLRITTPRIRRCGLIGYTHKPTLQEALDWENTRVNQIDRIQVELDKRNRAGDRRLWEQNYAKDCWIKRGWTILPGRIGR